MKLSFNKYYIVFNLLGWILLFLFTLTIRKIYLFEGEDISDARFKYLWVEGIACGFLGFALSFIVSVFIDLKLNFNAIKRLDVFKVLILFLFIQIIYSLLIWPFLDFVDFFGGSLPEIAGGPLTIAGRVSNFLYFGTLFVIWLFVFLTIKIYYQLKKVQLRQLQLEANLKESQLNTLKGQINPHFMFNSLNNIRGLMLEDVTKARGMLTNLSETLRYSLTKSEVNSIALEDELEMVENYVEISKIQFENRLKFESNIESDTLNIQIPPMIIQMLVENALKHGISNLKSGGIVKLSTIIENNQLQIKVANSGTLKKSNNSTHLGLQNIKKRLELLYGKDASFTLNEIEKEVIATIKMPLI
ncbi:sensor histidine kinase [Winogradskyella endarachnes]|uniref:Histidine kinase n=1 Tax=Winogradskyella endarachnes TaxID=2681965 RepID=A0A6L6UB80_9FLAO|nr:histidine kinase [Winogradskyella endarachnes]MUU79560.1 histidine kinase [Winogradskyella endarachnes]